MNASEGFAMPRRNGSTSSSRRTRRTPCGAVVLLATLSALAVLGSGSALRPQEAPRLNEVKLPLKEYLALVEAAERVEKERLRSAAGRTEPLAEVATQSTRITIGEELASVQADFEVLVQGHPKSMVLLPAYFVTRSSEVKVLGGRGEAPGAALTGAKNEVFLVAPEAGRYAVHLEGDARLQRDRGVSRYVLAPVVAPVAVADVDLAAELDWSVVGGVVVEEKVEGGRRKVRLSARRGMAPTIEVHRKLEGGDAEKLLAQAVVLTLFQLGPEGAQRHDVILYEVSRGSLARFTVDLPPGLEVEKAGTDEGEMVPVTDVRRLTIHRRSQLQKSGYMVLSSTPDPSGELTLAPILPGVPVRARYLAVASTVAAEAKPVPAANWTRVDLEDLPASFRDALSALDPTAAWRSAEKVKEGEPASPGAESRLQVARVRSAPVLGAVVRSRETTTVVTVDGTVLHRDRFVLHPISGVAAALDLTLPQGGTLWSVKVDYQPVRPLEKNGVVTIPLGFNEGKGPVVEVVSVLAKAIPKGRSDLDLELPRLAAPVQDHRWRLLLPSGPQYRFQYGDLRPVPVSVPKQWTGTASYFSRKKAPQQPAEVEAGVPGGVPGGVSGGVEGGVAAAKPERQAATGATVRQEELEKIPTARDPWAILPETPGVLTDRINVGGNESGQASFYDADAF
jgi:hypothetical protein